MFVVEKKLSYVNSFHFIGVGGSGMSSLARLLLLNGFSVSGCDVSYSETVKDLEKYGLSFFRGHSREHINKVDVVVYSSAVSPDNEEIQFAKRKNKIVLKRIELLAEILRLKNTICVLGSHGKTTTTTLISYTLKKGGKKPLSIIGGIAKNDEDELGYGSVAVAEIDESDTDFLKVLPFCVVITNIDREHEEKWGGFENLKKAILSFVNSVPIWGFVVLNQDDANSREIIPYIKRKVITCSLEDERANFYVKNLYLGKNSRYDIVIDIGEGKIHVEEVELGIPGLHNIYNSLLSFAVCYIFGVDLDVIKSAFRTFEGVKRRIELVAEKDGVFIVDDYAHHPTEIKATLLTLRQIYSGRIFLIFEPHRFSRVHNLKKEFADALSLADSCIITDIYPASEENVWNVSPQSIISFTNEKNIRYVPYKFVVDEAKEILKRAGKGDVIVFMGAGKIKDMLSKFLGEISPE
ncbi:UDP-N-acetylmuramate--L-alanine ligase [bacterium HR19]|nr:UDP-N-acetylmuramate--L-alanine ligase [bacterium HR19]